MDVTEIRPQPGVVLGGVVALEAELQRVAEYDEVGLEVGDRPVGGDQRQLDRVDPVVGGRQSLSSSMRAPLR